MPPELAVVCFSPATSATLAFYQLPALPEHQLPEAGHDRARTLPVYRALTERTAAHTSGRAFGLAVQAVALAAEGDRAARPTVRDAVAHARASVNPTAIALTRYAEARIVADDDPGTAPAALDEARPVAAATGCRLLSAFTFAATVALRGRHAEAVDLAAGLRHAANVGICGADVERLGTNRHRAVWSAGALRSLDDTAQPAQQLLAAHRDP